MNRIHSAIIGVALLGLLAGRLWAVEAWRATDYTKRVPIVVDNTNISAGPLTDFPALIKATDTWLPGPAGIPAGECASKCYRVYAEGSATDADFEEEAYSEPGSYANFESWCALTLDADNNSATDDNIWLYYNYDVGGDQSTATGVWDADFKHVYHLAEDPSGGAPQMLNSKTGAKDGTSYGTMLSGDLVAAKIGNGLDFDGTDDYMEAPIQAGFDSANPHSVSCWVKANVAGDPKGILKVQQADTTASNICMMYLWTSYDGYAVGHMGQNPFLTPDAAVTQTDWHHIAFVSSGGVDQTLYVDGVAQAATVASELSVDGNAVVNLGRAYSSYYGNLVMDEMRAGPVARTAGHIGFEFAQGSEADNELTAGSPETYSPPGGGTPIHYYRRRWTQ